MCGTNLKSYYILNETKTLEITQGVCGNPKPVVRWKFEKEGKEIYRNSTTFELKDSVDMQYSYTFVTRQLLRNQCGTKIMFHASGFGDIVQGEAIVNIACKDVLFITFVSDNVS